jgi:hypothetical protein
MPGRHRAASFDHLVSLEHWHPEPDEVSLQYTKEKGAMPAYRGNLIRSLGA